MRILFSSLLASIFCFQIGNAQQLTKKHRVKKGETVYQISRMYQVSPKEIIRLNPNSAKVIYVDDVLIIPTANDSSNIANPSNNVSNSSQTVSHRVLRGETKYGLSKKYGISISELEQQNPHIKNGLQAGHNLSIRTTKLQPVQNTSKSQNVTYLTHKVLKGETLYGLSKRYQVTIGDIQSANPDLGILKYNTIINIPSFSDISQSTNENVVEELKVTENPTETIAEKETTEIKISEENTSESNVIEDQKITYKDYTIKPKETLYGLSKKANMSKEDFLVLNPQLKKSVLAGTIIKMPVQANQSTAVTVNLDEPEEVKTDIKNLEESIDKTANKKVLFVMPFSETELTSDDLEINKTEAFKRNLDFYQGATSALDSLKKLGLTINHEIIKIDLESSVTPSNVRAKNNTLEGYHAVFAPSYTDNIDWLISVANDKNIPVISAYNASQNQNLKNVIEAYPSLNNQKIKTLDYIKNKQGTIIVISDYNREDQRNFIRTHAPEAKIIETKKNGNYSSRDLTGFLDKNKPNFVIIDSDRNGVFLNATNTLLRESSNYKIQLAVLEKDLIPDEADISIKRFTILKLVYPEVIHNSNSIAYSQFESNYKLIHKNNPSLSVIEGYDITYDTLLRMCQLNNNGTMDLDGINTSQIALDFKYLTQSNGRKANDIIVVKEFESKNNINN